MIVTTNDDNISIDIRGFAHDSHITYRDLALIARSQYWVLYGNKNVYVRARNIARGFRVVKLTKP